MSDDAAAIWSREQYRALVPELVVDANKYTRGCVAVVGGSASYPGAPVLSAQAAARCGAGYTRLVVPACAAATARAHVLSIPVSACSDLDGGFCSESVAAARIACEKSNAIALGPGIGRGNSVAGFIGELLEQLVQEGQRSFVLDADALVALAANPQFVDVYQANPCVLTPHEGEAARLLGRRVQDRLSDARELAQQYACVVVLKGPHTLVVDRGGAAVECQHGGPELAKAGTGDVLTGIITSLMAQGLPAFEAAALGVFVHADAGARVAAEKSAFAVMPEDIIETIGSVFKNMGA